MVEKIEKYRAKDGSEWSTTSAASEREKLLDEVAEAMKLLPRMSGLQSGQFVQRDKVVLLEVRRKVFELVRRDILVGFPTLIGANADDCHPMGGVGRIVSDCGGPIANAWNSLCVYDFKTGREYSQPYFANNPGESTEKVDPSTAVLAKP